jgi:DNA-binding MarR family transcriptional regulator
MDGVPDDRVPDDRVPDDRAPDDRVPDVRVPDVRTANVLGALALLVGDRMEDAVAGASGHSVTAATALSALYHFLDRPSIDQLHRVLGLSSSGTVRLVDRLEADGLVVRGAGSDARSTTVSLTEAGREAAAAVASARSAVLSGMLDLVPPADRAALADIGARMLAAVMLGPGPPPWVCRLCDTISCGHADGGCPISRAVADARGSGAGEAP